MSAYLDKPCRSLRDVILARVGTPGRLTMPERIDQLAFLLAYECGSPQGIVSAVTRTTEARRILAERRANGGPRDE